MVMPVKAITTGRLLGQSGVFDQELSTPLTSINKLTLTLLEFAKASGLAGGLEIDLVRIDEILLRLPGEISKADRSFSGRKEHCFECL